MRCVIQRSGPASVTVDGKVTGAIDRGLVVLAAFAAGDTDAELEWMARKLPALRIFADDEGRLNRSLTEVGAASCWSASSRSTATAARVIAPASWARPPRIWPRISMTASAAY